VLTIHQRLFQPQDRRRGGALTEGDLMVGKDQGSAIKSYVVGELVNPSFTET